MATGVAKESTAGTAAGAKQQQLVAEAWRVAREHHVDVHAVAFWPGGGAAVQHEFLGVPLGERVVGKIRRAVARDVSTMGAEEVAAHERQLRMLKAVVERELQAKAPARAAAAAAERTPEQKEQQEAGCAGASESKVKRIEIE